MAFPVDAGRLGTNGSTAATNKVCNLRGSGGGNPVSGDLLILLLRSAGADTHTTPIGWTQLVLNNADDASNDTTSIWRRVADGTEGASVTVNGTASLKFAAICWAITGHDGATAPVISATTTGTSVTPDPASLTPAVSAEDFLWLWVGGWEGEQTSPPTGSPTNYINPFGADSGTGGVVATNCRAAGATRQLNAASEDPPLWTISVSDDWSAWTIAVYPVVAQTFFITLTVVAVGVATLAKVAIFPKTIAATAIGVASLTLASVIGITLAAVAVGVATLSKIPTFVKTLAATAIGVATMTQIVTYARTLAATAVGVATLTRKQFMTLAATASGVATMTDVLTLKQVLASVAVGVATLTKQFIAGAAAAARRLSSIPGRHGRGRGRGR